jgi:tetratricopeptide (TPR) repeat protein
MKPQLKKQIRVIVSVAASFGLAAMLVQNYRRENETNQRLADMQRQLQDASAARNSKSVNSMAPIFIGGGATGSAIVSKQRDTEEIMDAGWKLIDQRSPDQAAKAVYLFNEGITNVDPTNPDLYNGLGRALLIAGKPREAIAAWRKGLALAPNFSDMQSGIGWAYWMLNDACRAKEAWQRALVMNPHSVDAWSAMAWIDLAFGKNMEAKDGFQELVKFDSGRKSWVMGLSMAQGHNTDIEEISQLFPLPALPDFERPLPVDPASVPDAPASRP